MTSGLAAHRTTASYIAPFAAFVSIMALERLLSLPPAIYYPVRFAVVLAVLLTVSRGVFTLRPSHTLWSVLLGVAVFAIWIGPDILFGYRSAWIFQNGVTGFAVSSVPGGLQKNAAFAALRATSCTLLVPVIEELFWRGWLMRWFVARDFEKVPYTRYYPMAFWCVAVLFASEHGPYWEVGLIAGIMLNWWVIRTGNLADAILSHAVTNGLLSAYVLLTDQWQYWL
jgi:CAAX prenyl protease-like protein